MLPRFRRHVAIAVDCHLAPAYHLGKSPQDVLAELVQQTSLEIHPTLFDDLAVVVGPT